mgnify:CR=1 FL=1
MNPTSGPTQQMRMTDTDPHAYTHTHTYSFWATSGIGGLSPKRVALFTIIGSGSGRRGHGRSHHTTEGAEAARFRSKLR